jgi:enoyl-CoA hydratase/carnithine racemase
MTWRPPSKPSPDPPATVGRVSALEIDVSDRVMTLTINRPQVRNAANDEVWLGLDRGLAEAAADPGVRVVVLTGAGDAFCSGQDLSAPPDSEPLGRMRWLGSIALRLHRLPKVTIAKVGGVAAGAGANLALGCDLVVASTDARFIQIFAKRGLSVDFGGTWLLPRLVGLGRAKELAFLAAPLGAEEAAAAGLVNRVVPPDQLDAVVDGWARELAAGPPLALSLTKSLLNESFATTLEQALEGEARAQVINLRGPEAREALAAFVERRPARFE